MEVRIKSENNSNALIIFTREPLAGKTKTRMMPYLSPEQCAELHRCMLRDIAAEAKQVDADVIVAYTGDDPVFLSKVFGKAGRLHCGAIYIRQRGSDIGEKMENAVSDVLGMGYQKAVLIGTDIPEIEAESIDAAFTLLDVYDVVLGPTEDGGYYLTGMKSAYHEAFDVKQYGTGTVYEETVRSLEEAGLSTVKADIYADIDIPEDAAGYRRRMREDPHLRHSHTGRFLRDNMKISVIIPVYNESKEIGRMLDQLNSYQDRCEIIFVDGESTDGTAESIENAGFTVLHSEKGRARQMNRGAFDSSGDVLFFLHCDSILPDDFDREIKKVMAKNEWGCFGVKFPSRNFFMLTNRVISNHRAFRRQLPFGDQGIFIDRDLFFETGMFPEIPVMEDYEFSRRLRRYGFRPGMTAKRIISSPRRYGKGTRSILQTEISMWYLRYLYRKGCSSEKLQEKYMDIR